MGEPRRRLCRHQRAGQGGVHVSHDDHPVRCQVIEQGFEGEHHPCCLLGMGTRTGPEMMVGLAEPELIEEDVAHDTVVVLAGVHQRGADRTGLEGVEHWLDLHEVRSRGRHAEDMQGDLHRAETLLRTGARRCH